MRRKREVQVARMERALCQNAARSSGKAWENGTYSDIWNILLDLTRQPSPQSKHTNRHSIRFPPKTCRITTSYITEALSREMPIRWPAPAWVHRLSHALKKTTVSSLGWQQSVQRPWLPYSLNQHICRWWECLHHLVCYFFCFQNRLDEKFKWN